ncbi:MAG: cupin domain-containing protein [Alphaproteobacteria bacterium]|nr:cupin domain-containing protein [Alphaproteobacteria bacterium]
MKLDKPAVDFHTLDIGEGWEPAPGAAPGIEQKLLSGELDETNKVGARTRLIRFQAGAVAPDQFVHDYWEEVYLISGQLTVGNDAKGDGGTTYAPPSYACRPPGTYHGPFTSKGGCLFLEIQYYA